MPGLDCACGSGRRYPDCCRPFHRYEREAPDAESLIRARFSAFALGNAGFLRKTLHPEHEDSKLSEEEATSDVRKAARMLRYRSVRVLEVGLPDATGAVAAVFLARIFQSGKERSFVERSLFLHDGTGLRYRSGITRPVGEIKGDPAALRLADFA